MSQRIIIVLLCITLGFCNAQVSGMKELEKGKDLGVTGSSVGSGANLARQNIEKLISAKELPSQQLKQLQYVPLDGAIRDDFIIGPNDMIHLQVWGPNDADELIPVSSDGFAVLKGYGAVKVAGLRWGDAKKAIEDIVVKEYKPETYAITLAQVRIFYAHISGSILFPGSYQIWATGRIWDLIQIAGNKTGLGDLTKVHVIHRNGDSTVVNISSYLSSGDLSDNLYLRDGDMVFIPQIDASNGLVSIYGVGIRSGYYEYINGESVNGFMKRSGAFSQSNDLKNVCLIRQKKSFKLNLFEEDMNLKADDVIVIPTKLDSIIVGGLVAKGGSFPYYAAYTVESYVAMAGGPAEKGNISSVVVYRNGVKLKPRKAYPLMPGDVIIVKYDPFVRFQDFWKTSMEVLTSVATILIIIERLK